MDHRGSLLWGRYEMDCCRFAANRFGGNGIMGDVETTSELEEALDNGSTLEVVRWNGRGGNECRLVGAVIFSRPLAGSAPATVSTGEKQRESGTYRLLILMCSVGNHPKFGAWATRNRGVSKFGK